MTDFSNRFIHINPALTMGYSFNGLWVCIHICFFFTTVICFSHMYVIIRNNLLLLLFQQDFNVLYSSIHRSIVLVLIHCYCLDELQISYRFGLTWDCIHNNFILGVNCYFNALVYTYSSAFSVNQGNVMPSWLFWVTCKMLVFGCTCCCSSLDLVCIIFHPLKDPDVLTALRTLKLNLNC